MKLSHRHLVSRWDLLPGPSPSAGGRSPRSSSPGLCQAHAPLDRSIRLHVLSPSSHSSGRGRRRRHEAAGVRGAKPATTRKGEEARGSRWAGHPASTSLCLCLQVPWPAQRRLRQPEQPRHTCSLPPRTPAIHTLMPSSSACLGSQACPWKMTGNADCGRK